MTDKLTIVSICSLSIALIITFTVLCSCMGGFEATNQDLQYIRNLNDKYMDQIQAQRGRISELENQIELINTTNKRK